ncbi:MAG: bifunctional diaminohydroxyphosphoribosylaminopyrimidine deaminase/5-amino-6-(5-phosphoribosylamino)uracil reductase RibD [Candidatus Bilamarchaeaceae archaeon]
MEHETAEEALMRRCLALANKAERTLPNPKVGALIVKDGLVVAEGFHKGPGHPHAELDAMHKCSMGDLLGSTLFVSLEPCVHSGGGKRTPPCVEAILLSGVKEVVCAMQDPNPKVSGKGIAKLKSAGVKVRCGVLEPEARALNEKYIKSITTGMPFVSMKAAMSMDGRIATRTGDSKWISGEKSRHYSHRLRNEYDAIMVGINTVLKDNPRLTCRIRGGRNPARIIVDTYLHIPFSAEALANPKRDRVIIAAGNGCDRKKKARLEAKGVTVIECGKGPLIDLRKLISALSGFGIHSVLLEGGAQLNGAMLDNRLIDKFYFFVAQKIIGGERAKGSIAGEGAAYMNESIHLRNTTFERIGNDFLFVSYPVYEKTRKNKVK